MRCITFSAAIFLIFPLSVFAACQSEENDQSVFVVAQWNVQTLFDGQEDGREYRDFREGAGWTAEKYQARITAISQAVLQMANPAPEIIGFSEIENAAVLRDLASGELSRSGYLWTAFANIPGAPIGLGFLSRFPLSDVRAHSITINGVTAPRPVFEVRIEPEGKPLVIFLCHWKSKVGGVEVTAEQRRASAQVVHRRLAEIKGKEPGTPVIIMGDLNENHDEFERHLGGLFSALLPDNYEAALLAGSQAPDFLVISNEKPPRSNYFPEGIHALYSPWGNEKTGGSYFFRDRWETIDHFLLSAALFDGEKWEFENSLVLNSHPFTLPDGTPNRYNPRSGRGLSDHLPLLLFLRIESSGE
ncbi:MAG: endonuclease/exonuclease/phosphatase family protein [Treponema sp.]|jgi:endonuclease/exonuclease/phosphatase family metal-dependent hydrolase|nr:endonuclease/exonuclease/phosphatase family protein [Treponema sp.]